MSDDPLSDEHASRIADAIESIEESRTALRQKQSLSPTAYKAPTNRDLRKATERDFVTIAEAIVDIAELILMHEHDDVPAGRKQKVRALHSVGVLDEEVTHKLEEAVGFRDVLSHLWSDRQRRSRLQRPTVEAREVHRVHGSDQRLSQSEHRQVTNQKSGRVSTTWSSGNSHVELVSRWEGRPHRQ